MRATRTTPPLCFPRRGGGEAPSSPVKARTAERRMKGEQRRSSCIAAGQRGQQANRGADLMPRINQWRKLHSPRKYPVCGQRAATRETRGSKIQNSERGVPKKRKRQAASIPSPLRVQSSFLKPNFQKLEPGLRKLDLTHTSSRCRGARLSHHTRNRRPQ